jgi:hypothetical protein
MYVIDSSSLINLGRHYPKDIFPSAWTALEKMIGNGRLISPREVLRELLAGDDQLASWAKAIPGFFIDVSADQTAILQEIISSFPNINDTSRLGPHADPWVVTLAVWMVRNRTWPSATVVADERKGGPGSHKIPNVCAAFHLGCCNLLDFYRTESIKF